MALFTLIDHIIFAIMSIFIGYNCIFITAAFLRKKKRENKPQDIQKFAVIFPAYKEDNVICHSVENFLKQDYPREKYDVIVVSDNMKEGTNDKLASFPIKLFLPKFKESMKYKSIQYALNNLNGYDRVIIMDADNLVEINFLSQVNIQTQNGVVLQAHRTYKNVNTKVAVWDGISEAINNTIYRRGHVALGLSAALIGSGMVFDFNWLKENIRHCSTFAEDKELEILLAQNNIPVDYADDIYVYDEKTTREDVLIRQRSRWLHAQFMAFSLIIKDLSFKNISWNYIDKIFQWLPLPKAIRFTIITLFTVINSLFFFPLAIKWYILIGIKFWSYFIAIPQEMLNKNLFSNLPNIFWIMLQSFVSSLKRLKNKITQFDNTPHEIIKKDE